jgi:AcrR family transcriptional regulator
VTGPSHGNARSRRTRALVLGAARRVIEEEGFERLTMERVAARAGVTRRAVYLHFRSPAALVGDLFGFVARTEGLDESTARVWASPDAVTALDEWARHLARYHPRLLPLALAVDRARRYSADANRHHRRVVKAQRANCRRLAAWLDREGRLAARWTVGTATDMLWSLTSSEMIERLVIDRRWPLRRLADQLSYLFRATFVRGGGDELDLPDRR